MVDHLGIFHSVKNKSTHPIVSNTKLRSISDKNMNLFRLYLDEADFTEVFHLNCPNDAYTQFSTRFTYGLIYAAHD